MSGIKIDIIGDRIQLALPPNQFRAGLVDTLWRDQGDVRFWIARSRAIGGEGGEVPPEFAWCIAMMSADRIGDGQTTTARDMARYWAQTKQLAETVVVEFGAKLVAQGWSIFDFFAADQGRLGRDHIGGLVYVIGLTGRVIDVADGKCIIVRSSTNTFQGRVGRDENRTRETWARDTDHNGAPTWRLERTEDMRLAESALVLTERAPPELTSPAPRAGSLRRTP